MPVFFDAETSGLFKEDDPKGAPDIYCVCAYDSALKTMKRFYEPRAGPCHQTASKRPPGTC